MTALCLALSAFALPAFPSPSGPATAWDEDVDGDLSGVPGAPTAVSFVVGANTVSGSVTTSGPGDTRDYLTFTIPCGQELVALRQIEYVDIPSGGPGNTGYYSINAGSTSLIPGAGNLEEFLGGDHLNQVTSGTDVLPVLASAPLAGTGFTVPLGEGDYTFLVQQTGPEISGYTFEFVIGDASVAATEVVRLGAPANPQAFEVGQTSAPVVGATWDPVIDHTTFLPGALLDAVLVSFGPANLSVPPLGTLLCDLGPPLFVFASPGPGMPFQILIPDNCNLAGVQLCAQGVSSDGVNNLFTNALDIQIGTF